ncbi:MAG: hypothetical protein COB66_04410 [Coxiella sp. (in: Bacteria)]|nr:MAG: hypothetical protein COB66_04410 [Coxiella sp. (in: g-proteobacteria)]
MPKKKSNETQPIDRVIRYKENTELLQLAYKNYTPYLKQEILANRQYLFPYLLMSKLMQLVPIYKNFGGETTDRLIDYIKFYLLWTHIAELIHQKISATETTTNKLNFLERLSPDTFKNMESRIKMFYLDVNDTKCKALIQAIKTLHTLNINRIRLNHFNPTEEQETQLKLLSSFASIDFSRSKMSTADYNRLFNTYTYWRLTLFSCITFASLLLTNPNRLIFMPEEESPPTLYYLVLVCLFIFETYNQTYNFFLDQIDALSILATPTIKTSMINALNFTKHKQQLLRSFSIQTEFTGAVIKLTLHQSEHHHLKPIIIELLKNNGFEIVDAPDTNLTLHIAAHSPLTEKQINTIHKKLMRLNAFLKLEQQFKNLHNQYATHVPSPQVELQADATINITFTVPKTGDTEMPLWQLLTTTYAPKPEREETAHSVIIRFTSGPEQALPICHTRNQARHVLPHANQPQADNENVLQEDSNYDSGTNSEAESPPQKTKNWRIFSSPIQSIKQTLWPATPTAPPTFIYNNSEISIDPIRYPSMFQRIDMDFGLSCYAYLPDTIEKLPQDQQADFQKAFLNGFKKNGTEGIVRNVQIFKLKLPDSDFRIWQNTRTYFEASDGKRVVILDNYIAKHSTSVARKLEKEYQTRQKPSPAKPNSR